MDNFQLAQINVARIRGVNIGDPIMKEFVDNLDNINELAEQSEGFVWRLKDDSNNATSLNPYDDEQIIINISVWQNIEALEKFVYHTYHSEFLRRRKEWFVRFGKAYYALWWIKAGDYPTISECISRLDYLQANGSSIKAFDFRNRQQNPSL